MTNDEKIIQFLAETSVNDKLSLKVLLDKWLLHQPLFRGNYAKNTTFSALLRILKSNNPNISSLNVVGFNPSHKNVKSEVNAPFKMLSTLLRMIKNEERIEKLRKRCFHFCENIPLGCLYLLSIQYNPAIQLLGMELSEESRE
jgi:hypothetical protein